MTETPQARALRVAPRRAGGPAPTASERLLVALGADPDFIDGVFGDFAEEYAVRLAHDGAPSAAAWRAWELVRSMPHLLLCALRHGGPRAYLRVGALLTIVMLPLAVVVVAILTRDGAPATLDAGLHQAGNGFVVNNLRPVQLQMRVRDKAGHALPSDSVRFAWASGSPLTISPLGILTCRERANATVRASLGSISTIVDVRCRPVQEIRATTWIDFIEGDTTTRHLPFEAIGNDGRPVMELRGAVRIFDTDVAALEGANIRAKAVGQTFVVVEIGEQEAQMMVVVHQRVRTFEQLRDDQRYVARAVRLAHGDTVHWAVPHGTFWLKYLPRRAGEAPPTITVVGSIGCTPGDGIHVRRMPLGEFGTYCLVQRTGDISVTLAHGMSGAEWVEGTLAIERVQLR
ncbi:MAG: hypothetical protein ABI910_01505 [Gemmatimonadota bacterium]